MKPSLITSALIICAALSGCASVSEVSQLDKNTYFLTVDTGNQQFTTGDLLSKASVKATEFCGKRGRSMSAIGSDLDHRGFGNRDLTLRFRCVE